ncbi:HNH endonuclease signature motif containing protein [Nocardioides acrostichi]|uniref:DUF222 domain-containing protein n=1 Tax=Nocardioides acrostichi TaxID=2784339 RepID=A0A930UYY2_9ACTN|nr:HNH endonuclease signature motif containing protein [Nocardioides acrostichi]MBF4160816.1 DUF222 domain-containing protein [Nocardioides acrostichi]
MSSLVAEPLIAGMWHPLGRVVEQLDAALDDAEGLSLWGLDQASTAGALSVLTALESRLVELEHRVLAHAGEVVVADTTGAVQTSAWLAGTARLTRAEARRRVWLAHALERYGALRAAFADGSVNREQAPVIAGALDDLPDDLDADVVEKAERFLVEQAALHDARDLRVMGRHLLEVVDPERGEREAAKRLEAEEEQAAQRARLTMSDDGHGTVFGRFQLPALHGAMFKKALDAILAPGHWNSEGHAPKANLTTPQQNGEALCELLETLTERDLPTTGGLGATVVVTMTLDALRGGLTEAVLDTGDRLSAATARRLACGANLVPVVLDGDGVPLDLGRGQRLYSKGQRLVLAVRDRHCTAEGCETPAHRCQAHHDHPWSQGGPTDLADGRLLCWRHHRMVHDPGWAYEIHRTGPPGTRSTIRFRLRN